MPSVPIAKVASRSGRQGEHIIQPQPGGRGMRHDVASNGLHAGSCKHASPVQVCSHHLHKQRGFCQPHSHLHSKYSSSQKQHSGLLAAHAWDCLFRACPTWLPVSKAYAEGNASASAMLQYTQMAQVEVCQLLPAPVWSTACLLCACPRRCHSARPRQGG